MSRRRATLGTLWIGGLGALGVLAPALASRPPEPRLAAANSYGDTVWFDSDEIADGPPVRAMDPFHGGTSPTPKTPYASARVRTRGTAVLIVMHERDPAPSSPEIIRRALQFPSLGLAGHGPASDWNITTLESSAFDSFQGRKLDTWEVDFAPGDSSAVRLLFVVIGLSDSSVSTSVRQSWQEPWGAARSAGDPMPLRTDRHLRPFDIPVADRMLTARLVGEFRANLKRRHIELVSLAEGRERADEGRWRYSPCTLSQ